MIKKNISTLFITALIFALFANQVCFAVNSGVGLTWDGKESTLKQIADKTGYDLVDANGNYKPLYTFAADALWNDGLFLGSNGSFDLDMPLTREQGIVLVLRILGKDKEALSQNLPCKFTDVAVWAAPYVAYAEKNGLTTGISATEFGGSNVMNANQYCTFALRALGYKDGEDFVWNKAIAKALEIGLIGESCHLQYAHSNLFLRDNAVMISYNALYKDIMKTSGKLISTINAPGKPTGDKPYATAALRDAAKPSTGTDTPKQTDNSGVKVAFSEEAFTYVNKTNGSLDYIAANIRLNFTVPPSGAAYKTNWVTFRIVQIITPASGSLKQEITTKKEIGSNTTINGTSYNGFMLLNDKLQFASSGGVNSVYDIYVYNDSTDELIGKYHIVMPTGGYFYFK